MPLYGFYDPEWDARLWYGMGFGRQLVVNPVSNGTGDFVQSNAVRTAGISRFESGISRFEAGSFDPIGWVSHAASDVGDAVSDTVNAIGSMPGIRDLAGLAKDFANTAVGHAVLLALGSSVYVTLAPILGAQGASIAFAIPGLVRGEPFDQAYWSELKMRLEKTAEIAGPDVANVAAAQLKPAEDFLQANGGQALQLLDQGKATLTDLAKQAGVREDMMQSAIDLAKRSNSFGLPETHLPAVLDAVKSAAANAVHLKLPQVDLPARPGKFFDPASGREIKPAPAPVILPSAAARVASLYFPLVVQRALAPANLSSAYLEKARRAMPGTSPATVAITLALADSLLASAPSGEVMAAALSGHVVAPPQTVIVPHGRLTAAAKETAKLRVTQWVRHYAPLPTTPQQTAGFFVAGCSCAAPA